MNTKSVETMSQIISDLPQSLVIDAKQILGVRLKSKDTKPDGVYKGAEYFHLGDVGSGYWVLVNSNKEIVYFVRYELIKHNGFKLGRQVLVWNDKSSVYSVGFARFIFFNKLLPEYHALVADQQQTKDGQSFWRYSADYAFETKRHVYVLDRLSSPNTLTELMSIEELAAKSKEVWGTSDKFKRIFLVISDKPIKMTPKAERKFPKT